MLDLDRPGLPSLLRRIIGTALCLVMRGARIGAISAACTVFDLSKNPGLRIPGTLWDALTGLIWLVVTLDSGVFSLFAVERTTGGVRFRRQFKLLYGVELNNSHKAACGLLQMIGFWTARSALMHYDGFFLGLLYLVGLRHPPTYILIPYAFYTLRHMYYSIGPLNASPPEGSLLSAVGQRAHYLLLGYMAKRRAAVVYRVIRGAGEGALDPNLLYRYEPVEGDEEGSGAIRLLKVSTTGCRTECTIHAFELENLPPYWAISYVWGSSETPIHLRVQDKNKNTRYVPIGLNCCHTLIQLLPLGTRYLWIDSICIDQKDAKDKKRQVGLMDQIYSRASLVVGHVMGDEVHGAEVFLEYIVLHLTAGLTSLDFEHASIRTGMSTLSTVFSSQYWDRAWIIQEIVLARKHVIIRCGECLPWEQLALVAREAQTLQPQTELEPSSSWMGWDPGMLMVWARVFQDKVAMIENLRRSLANPRMAIEIVNLQRTPLEATNPRDHIYAMLSLASDSAAPALRPNYESDVPNRDIFIGIAWHYLSSESGPSLSNLFRAGLAYRLTIQTVVHTARDNSHRFLRAPSPECTPGLPSWVQDFGFRSMAREGNWMVGEDIRRSPRLKCCISTDHAMLSVRGVEIGQVVAVSSGGLEDMTCDFYGDDGMMTSHVSIRDILGVPFQLEASIRRLVESAVPDPYPGGGSRDEAYWRVLIMDRLGDKTPAPPRAGKLLDLMRKIARQMDEGDADAREQAMRKLRQENGPLPDLDAETVWALARGEEIWVNYTFALMDNGYMGWVPPGTQAGDVVVLFDNLRVPLVLRGAGSMGDAGRGRYWLYGDAFIQGFMHSWERERVDVEGRATWFDIV